MSTVEGLVVIAAGILGCVYAVHRLHKQRQILQWFYTRQYHQLSAQSEIIREQLLQQIFALRRALELGAMESSSVDATQRWESCLALVQTVDQSLEGLSHELSPPFVDESLPLALQRLIKQWGTQKADIQLRLDLPSVWPQQQPDKQTMVLWCIQQCLLVLQSAKQPAILTLGLIEIKGMAKLRLSWDGLTSDIINTTSLQHDLRQMQQIFQLFMPGHCQIICGETSVRCEFNWSLTHFLVNLDRSQ